MKNITELREELCSLYSDIKNGDIDAVKAKEMNNSAGKIIGTARAQIEYMAMTKSVEEIPFMK